MNTDPMTAQVDRLVGNLLAAGCDLFLPGIGSLCIEQHSARRIAKNAIEPPCRTVTFTSQEQGVSLVEEIARAAGCDEERAQSIYDRWLDNVIAENTLTIEGVGQLRNRRFVVDEEFDLQLNPQGHEPMKVKSGGDWTLWLCLLAIVAALVIGYFAFFAEKAELPALFRTASENPTDPEISNGPIEAAQSDAAATETSPAEASAAENPVQEHIRTQESVPPPAATQTPAAPQSQGTAGSPAQAQESAGPQKNAQGTVQAPATMVPGRHYVVGGVFSTPENAAKAVREIESQGPVRCTIYYFNNKLMVSPFESDDPAACRHFLRTHRDRWPDNWTYAAL